MCTTECHILKYLNQRLRVIYYNENNTAVAIALYDKNNSTLWYRLGQGENSITRDIKINWPSGKAICGFIVEHNGEVIGDDYYDHWTFSCDELPTIPLSQGRFYVTRQISQKFARYIGYQNIATTQMHSLNKVVPDNKIKFVSVSDGQWIFWSILLIIAIILLWFFINGNVS